MKPILCGFSPPPYLAWASAVERLRAARGSRMRASTAVAVAASDRCPVATRVKGEPVECSELPCSDEDLDRLDVEGCRGAMSCLLHLQPACDRRADDRRRSLACSPLASGRPAATPQAGPRLLRPSAAGRIEVSALRSTSAWGSISCARTRAASSRRVLAFTRASHSPGAPRVSGSCFGRKQELVTIEGRRSLDEPVP